MKRWNEEQHRPILLAAGVLLMTGWFAITAMQMEMRALSADGTAIRPGIPVLMYHHILPQEDITGMFADNNVVVSAERFKSDMETLKANGYETISLRQLNEFVRNDAPVPAKSVVITFDDGYLSNKLYAMPILKEAGYTAVIFALTGWMEEHPQQFDANGLQYLSWPEIKEMREVFQFASHTDNLHSIGWNGKGKLTVIPAEDFAVDVKRSIHKLQGTSYFSYPYGHYNEAALSVLKNQGVELAFTVNPESVHVGDNPLLLGRWDMYQYSIDDVLAEG